MASLRGYEVSRGWGVFLSQARAYLPKVTDGSDPWIQGFLLNADNEKDRKDFRIRPTGENNSGPYFHAIQNGLDGVTGAVRLYHNDHYIYAYQCDKTTENYTETSNEYCRWFCNGKQLYCIYCYLWLADYRPAFQQTATWHVICYEISRQPDMYGRYELVQAGSGETYYWFEDQPSWDYLMDRAQNFRDRFYSGWQGVDVNPTIFNVYFSRYDDVLSDADLHQDGGFHFLHGELNAFTWWDSIGYLPGRYNGLAGLAYNDAAANLPRSTTNSIANVLESAELVSAIIRRDFKSLAPDSLRSAWLQYRYQYNTTKADIEEYAELTRRLIAVAGASRIQSSGIASDGNITAHCSIYVSADDFLPSDTKEWLEHYGFQLSASNLWDMIPYSFIADWFLHISDFLEKCENANWAYELKVKDAWTSFRTSEGNQKTFFRVPGYYHTNTPWMDYTSTGPSNKTIVKRVLDSISIFT